MPDAQPERTQLIDGATLSAFRDGSTGSRFTYALGSRSWSASWDPREEGYDCTIQLHQWDDGTLLGDLEKKQIVERLWKFGVGARSLMENTPIGVVPRAWKVAAGFLVEIASTTVRYYEIDRLLKIPSVEAGLDSDKCTIQALVLPAQPAWDVPALEPIAPTRWREILQRIATTHGKDRIDQLGYRVQVPGFPLGPGY